MVNMRVFLSLLVSIISFSTPPLSANAVSGNVKQPQNRAVQYYVVDRKSQPQVLRDSLWFNDSSWYTYKYISVPNGYRPVGRVSSTVIASTGSDKRTKVSYYSYSYFKNQL
ncbi:hypothetical protein [Carnobacterium maltaromaticum]|uniref:hypothetical protein n=1 Tax=Carnobacterium maltaromaticum TaxID=2751 RepID=UPI00295E4783|nr:hypothetical protein [Carnobacterium maltaromaticum]